MNGEAFEKMYASELRAPGKQNLIRSLALLSLRRKLVILCACPDEHTCRNNALAQALEECRRTGVFHIIHNDINSCAYWLANFGAKRGTKSESAAADER